MIEGEKLDLLIGNRPIEQTENLDQAEKDAVKKECDAHTQRKIRNGRRRLYSAELEIVPAGKKRELWF